VTRTSKISRQGNSAGVRLPKAYLDHLGLSLGDRVALTLRQDRIEIARADGGFERAMDIGRRFATRYRRTLAKLAR